MLATMKAYAAYMNYLAAMERQQRGGATPTGGDDALLTYALRSVRGDAGQARRSRKRKTVVSFFAPDQ